MNSQRFIDKGLLKEEKIDFGNIGKILMRAKRDLKSASVLLKDGDEEGGFQFAYQSMLLAGRALVFSYGLRPRAVGSHKIVIDFVREILGEKYIVLMKKFDRMRKKRNYLIYGAGLGISETETENAIKSGEEFIKIVKAEIQLKNPQQKLL